MVKKADTDQYEGKKQSLNRHHKWWHLLKRKKKDEGTKEIFDVLTREQMAFRKFVRVRGNAAHKNHGRVWKRTTEMSGLKLKHHRRYDSTIASSRFRRPSGWSSAQLCRIFSGILPKGIKTAFSPDTRGSRSSPLAKLHFIKWYCFMHRFFFLIIISPDMWLCILPNRLTCLLFGLFAYVVVYRGEKSIWLWPIDTANTQ